MGFWEFIAIVIILVIVLGGLESIVERWRGQAQTGWASWDERSKHNYIRMIEETLGQDDAALHFMTDTTLWGDPFVQQWFIRTQRTRTVHADPVSMMRQR